MHPTTLEDAVNSSKAESGFLPNEDFLQQLFDEFNSFLKDRLNYESQCCWGYIGVLLPSRGNSAKEECAVLKPETAKTFIDQR